MEEKINLPKRTPWKTKLKVPLGKLAAFDLLFYSAGGAITSLLVVGILM